MYLITREEKLMLEMYKAIGTPEEIIRRLDHPFPEAEDGYAPVPWAKKTLRRMEDLDSPGYMG